MTKSLDLSRPLRMGLRYAELNFDFVRNYLEALDCPRSLTVWLLYKSGQHKEITQLSVDPDDYEGPFHFRDAYQATLFLKKDASLTTGIDLDEVALDGFLECEERCKETNRRFSRGIPNTDPTMATIISIASYKIQKILGDFDAEEMFSSGGWGPGATALLKGVDTSAETKYWSESGITHAALELIEPLFERSYPLWHQALVGFDIVLGNKILFVLKDATKHRTIAKEGGLLSYFQKALGNMFRKRLFRSGIDLSTQRKNQLLALEGSKNGAVATVDSVSASDCVATGLVRTLFGEFSDWFLVMNDLRSPLGFYKDRVIKYEKFSSMGNGFTFELETLIFYALASATMQHLGVTGSLSVYGDDVILPTEAFPLFCQTMEFCGFKINSKKSFSSGYFRESCGTHWYDGIDCTPFYRRGSIETVFDIFKAHNGVKRLAFRRNRIGLDRSFYRTCYDLKRSVRVPLRLSIPEGYGDGGFIADFDEASCQRSKDCWEGYFVKFAVFRPKTVDRNHLGVLLARLDSSVGDSLEKGNKVTYRGSGNWRIKPLFIKSWPWLGGWG